MLRESSLGCLYGIWQAYLLGSDVNERKESETYISLQNTLRIIEKINK